MAPRHHFATEIPQSIFEEEDIFYDTISAIPMATSTVPRDLSVRFIRRLGKLTAASIQMQEERSGASVEIVMSRNVGSPQPRIELDTKLKKFLASLRGLLELISQNRNGMCITILQAKEDLMDTILMFSFFNVEHVVDSLQRVFHDNENDYHELVTQVLGITAEKGSKVDTEVGDAIIKLEQLVGSYNKSPGELHTLIQLAAGMTKHITHIQDRLRFLLRRPKFSAELYQLICTLGFPERAHQTFVRTAQTSRSFRRIVLTTLPNPPSPTRTPIASSSTSPASSVLSVAQATIMPQEVKESPSQRQRPSHTSSSRDIGIYAIIRPYIAEDDRDVGIARLEPQVKQEVAQLAAAVLRSNLVPVTARIWHTFGFVTVNDVEEERHLAGLYAIVLKEAVDKQRIFQEIMRAVETDQLPQLFDRNGYFHFRQAFPRLEAFLGTNPAKRPTVWHLKHFLHDEDNMEPPAVLQRDYGFRYCRLREEVSRLKTIYAAILKEADIMDLHTACVYGRLVEFAAQKGIFVNPKDRRLMQNDYPASFIGFDNGVGLGAYRGTFFKRRL
ncbi:hypothetical protein IQ06DRAFT_218832 [Phaeosphaeriaceae sp. SRC1lsM3a]|nr:hypothetical protein IQ06DRAFT_218832 [Stagonospora sp. SRC1lsM3a]